MTDFKPAKNLYQIQNTLNIGILVDNPDHPFYVSEFEKLHTNFAKNFFKSIGINDKTLKLEEPIYQKLTFIHGFKGVGKTTILLNYLNRIAKKGHYLNVYCDINHDLDVNDLNPIDILLLQIMNLLQSLNQKIIDKDLKKEFEKSTLYKKLNDFQEFNQIKETEIINSFKADSGINSQVEAGAEAKIPFFGPLFKVLSNFTAKIKLGTEIKETIRKTYSFNLDNYLDRFNEIIEHANIFLQKNNLGHTVLFVLDGIEKIQNKEKAGDFLDELLRKISRIKGINIYTFPISIRNKKNLLQAYQCKFINFPFARVRTLKGELQTETINIFKEIVYKRIDPDLFESEQLLQDIIILSGGSIRQLFQLILETATYTDHSKITSQDFEEASTDYAKTFIQSIEEYEILDQVIEINIKKKLDLEDERESPDENKNFNWLVDSQLLFDYNNGTAFELNPLFEKLKSYQVRYNRIKTKVLEQNNL